MKAGITGAYIAVSDAYRNKTPADLPAHAQAMAQIIVDAQLPFEWSVEKNPDAFKDQDFIIIIGTGPKIAH